MNLEIPAQLLIDELKAQRNQAFDALALAGARIMVLEAKIAKLSKQDDPK